MSASKRPTDEDLEALVRDCDVEFTRAGGPGGQHRNKVETAVRIVHRPTGTVVLASQHRSQARNKTLALERLAGKLATAERERRLQEQRRNRPERTPSRAARQRRLDEKKQRSDKKRGRQRVRPPTDD